ncbi:MAG: hypothetical protein IKU06_02780 [Lachnospiraceae bacterium]|nr:hypothetical protein [Lachnospiraceae bacterium]
MDKQKHLNTIFRVIIIVVAVVSIIAVLLFCILVYRRYFKWLGSEVIIVKLEESPEAGEYQFEILDEGIIELKEKEKMGGAWGNGYTVTWVFEIRRPGLVRIKWSNSFSLKKWKNADSWIDTYTIDEDMTYTVERYYLDEYMNYFFYIAKQTDKGKKIEGYFIDINGDKRVYTIEDNENSINDVSDLYDYLIAHFSDYRYIIFYNTEGLQKCNEALMRVPEYLYDEKLELIYDKKTLYGVNDSNGKTRFLVCATEDGFVSYDENIKLIMKIFGDDWDKYES